MKIRGAIARVGPRSILSEEKGGRHSKLADRIEGEG